MPERTPQTLGGLARAKALSPDERRQIARSGARARWHPPAGRPKPSLSPGKLARLIRYHTDHIKNRQVELRRLAKIALDDANDYDDVVAILERAADQLGE
jgi:hypothetical protein